MISILYMIIVLIATCCGAIAGLGGGVIIKPLFDLIGFHNASTISVYSCFAVFTMCIVSIIKQMKKGFKFDFHIIVYISFGSLVGGIVGERIFNTATASMPNNIVKAIQACLLGIILILILLYNLNKDKVKHYKIHGAIPTFLIGMFLGTTSIFLGIGGGPLNVSLLMLLFSYTMKEATVYSISTIFFSQLSKISMLVMGGTLFTYDLSLIPIICISAIVGGYIGTQINQKANNNQIEKIYNVLMIVLLLISNYNFATNMFM
ncbi:MAG: sulfite exporter TauE/SafE family protein [Erysipelotrichaceae bacterium]|nr:sulfite exporter TauE/SafE family protein [Erysipelotrichaceae bacterium]